MRKTITPIKRALISVSDKNGVIDFARGLASFGVELLSTGGTAALLREAGLAVTDVSAYTGFPEIMEGRVKTLHPKIHGGILSKRSNPDHARAQEQHGIGNIDLVLVNLYPFSQTVQGGGDFASCIENIDIGGPAMIRAAAKNHDDVTIVVDPADYPAVLDAMKQNDGGVPAALRKRLAATAFGMTALYDTQIAGWFAEGRMDEDLGPPRRLSFGGTLQQTLRYGENPHQAAAFYKVDADQRPGAGNARQLQGKELSYNNLNDTHAAFELVAEFGEPAVAIIKHANPCGVAMGGSIEDAYKRALACDPTSAFGGIIALNRPLSRSAAEAITGLFAEVIIAPAVAEDALEILRRKDKIRVLVTGGMPQTPPRLQTVTRIAGGFLVQGPDDASVGANGLKVVTARAPSEAELRDMLFAFKIAKHVKSNAIVYASALATVGIGAGQMSRIDSSRIAAMKMRENFPLPEGEGGARQRREGEGQDQALNNHLVVASDAFFPFADGLIAAAEAGVSAVIQPGGSIRDAEVIEAANERGLAMVFTGVRHFKH